MSSVTICILSLSINDSSPDVLCLPGFKRISHYVVQFLASTCVNDSRVQFKVPVDGFALTKRLREPLISLARQWNVVRMQVYWDSFGSLRGHDVTQVFVDTELGALYVHRAFLRAFWTEVSNEVFPLPDFFYFALPKICALQRYRYTVQWAIFCHRYEPEFWFLEQEHWWRR